MPIIYIPLVMELKPKEQLLLSHFRQNARESLTRISRRTHVPVSTIFDRLKQYEQKYIMKHTTLLDFARMGFSVRANLLLRVGVDHRDLVKQFLIRHDHVNSLFKINNGFDFQAEVIFNNIKDLEEFIEAIERKYEILEKNVYFVIDDICREQFLANPELIH